MSTGWRCPGCGKCYAPWVSMCRECGEPEPSGNHTPVPLPPRVPPKVPQPAQVPVCIRCGAASETLTERLNGLCRYCVKGGPVVPQAERRPPPPAVHRTPFDVPPFHPVVTC